MLPVDEWHYGPRKGASRYRPPWLELLSCVAGVRRVSAKNGSRHVKPVRKF
ncbi:MAG: hypothetical protein ACI8W3_003515 [Myxococcota bacterium]|jgi:hypothetical protein